RVLGSETPAVASAKRLIGGDGEGGVAGFGTSAITLGGRLVFADSGGNSRFGGGGRKTSIGRSSVCTVCGLSFVRTVDSGSTRPSLAPLLSRMALNSINPPPKT